MVSIPAGMLLCSHFTSDWKLKHWWHRHHKFWLSMWVVIFPVNNAEEMETMLRTWRVISFHFNPEVLRPDLFLLTSTFWKVPARETFSCREQALAVWELGLKCHWHALSVHIMYVWVAPGIKPFRIRSICHAYGPCKHTHTCVYILNDAHNVVLLFSLVEMCHDSHKLHVKKSLNWGM